MTIILSISLFMFILTGCAGAPPSQPSATDQQPWLSQGLLGPTDENAYGLGVHRDATGQPFRYVPVDAAPNFADPLLRVRPNAYGYGVGADQYGRPVQAVPNPGFGAQQHRGTRAYGGVWAP